MTPSQQSIDAAVYRVTEWLHPSERIITAFGIMRADGWLQTEVERFKEHWCESWIESRGGLIALYTWAGSQLPVDDDDGEKE